MQAKPKSLTLSDRIYGLLLYAYPAKFRREYGPHMAQLFRDETGDTLGKSGTVGLAGLWLLTLADLLKTSLAEHIWEVFHMPMEKMQRWSGPAAAVGGLLWTFGVFWTVHDVDRVFGSLDSIILTGVFLLTMPFLAAGLAGLYRRLPESAWLGGVLALALVLIGLLLYNVGWVSLFLTDQWEGISVTAGFAGFAAFFLGIAGMGLIALFNRALGIWSFAPLAVAVSGASFIFSAGSSSSGFEPVTLVFLILYGMSWLLLGLALWTAPEAAPGPALQA